MTKPVTKPLLHLVYESEGQIREDCFVKQLYSVLEGAFALRRVPRADLVAGVAPSPARGEKVLSVLKLRNWRPLVPFLARFARDAQLFMYDQDPWEAYHDEGACRGLYELVSRCLPVERYLVTSSWWADFIHRRDGLPTGFVRMGAVAANCDVGPPFEQRPHEVGFQGTVHPHRRRFFERLSEQGVHTELLPRAPFDEFLRTVQQVGIYVYDDSAAIRVEGKPTSFHGLWGKCLTVAARGCFVIRNDDLSRDAYRIHELPTVFPYADPEEIPALVGCIREMSPEERWKRMTGAVDTIRRRNDWHSVVDAINAA